MYDNPVGSITSVPLYSPTRFGPPALRTDGGGCLDSQCRGVSHSLKRDATIDKPELHPPPGAGARASSPADPRGIEPVHDVLLFPVAIADQGLGDIFRWIVNLFHPEVYCAGPYVYGGAHPK